MKKFTALVSLMIILFANSAIGKTSKVIVKRIGENLYKTEKGLYIETSDCIEEVVENKAVLKYEKGSDSNKLIFEDGTSCPVVITFK